MIQLLVTIDTDLDDEDDLVEFARWIIDAVAPLGGVDVQVCEEGTFRQIVVAR